MLDANYDEQTLELTEFDYIELEDETTCDKYDALWEALAVDMISAEGIKRLLEHLRECPRCREACARLHKAGAYEATPFYDRMRDYENNPAAETDEDWKKIAFMFRPEWAYTAVPEGPFAKLAKRIFSQKEAEKRTVGNRWIYSAALLIGAAAGVVFWQGQNRELPPPCQLAYEQGRRGLDGNYKGLGGQLGILPFDFGEINEIYEEGAASFDGGDYSTAAEKFALLVKKLRGDEQALSVALWNLAVATIKSGDVATGVRVLEEIKAMNLDDEEMNARVDAAIKTYQTAE